MANLSTLVDDFDDGTIDLAKWPNTYGTVSEAGGRARITCNTGYSGWSTALIYTIDQVTLRLYPPDANGGTSGCYFATLIYSASQPAGTDIGFVVDPIAGSIGFVNWVGYVDGSAVIVPYSATDHAWVRLSVTGGNVLWQTAPDGLTWTTRRTLAAPAWVTSATDGQLILETHRDNGTANFAEFDNLNIIPFSTVNATGVAALGGLTAATTGVRSTPGTGAATLGGLTAAGTGVRTVPASSSTTLGALTSAATGTRTVPATAATGLAGLTAAATGTRTAAGTASATLGGLTEAGAGDRTTPGAALAVLGGLTAQATATSKTVRRPYAGITSRPYAGTTARP